MVCNDSAQEAAFGRMEGQRIHHFINDENVRDRMKCMIPLLREIQNGRDSFESAVLRRRRLATTALHLQRSQRLTRFRNRRTGSKASHLVSGHFWAAQAPNCARRRRLSTRRTPAPRFDTSLNNHPSPNCTPHRAHSIHPTT